MPLSIVLVQPEIPGNTGAVGRTCVALDAEIEKVLAANADKVAEYKAGKEQLFGFFVGQTMKAMQGKGNPKLVNERLRAKLA